MFRPLLGALIFTLAGALSQAAAQPVVYVIFFPRWSGLLDDSALNVIQQAAEQAKQYPNAHITVTGYADTLGSAAANLDLTQLRAQRVIDVLTQDGVPAERMDLVAKGAQPESGLAYRRVEIAISAP